MAVSIPHGNFSQDKPRAMETGLNYRQGEAVVSTDLPTRAKVMAEFVDANSSTEACKGHSRCDLIKEEKKSGVKCEIKMRDAR